MTYEEIIQTLNYLREGGFIETKSIDTLKKCVEELYANQMHTAEWELNETTEDGNFYTCSFCHASVGFAGEPTVKHCPECGSRMTNYVF